MFAGSFASPKTGSLGPSQILMSGFAAYLPFWRSINARAAASGAPPLRASAFASVISNTRPTMIRSGLIASSSSAWPNKSTSFTSGDPASTKARTSELELSVWGQSLLGMLSPCRSLREDAVNGWGRWWGLYCRECVSPTRET
jgi:hypothetical protein